MLFSLTIEWFSDSRRFKREIAAELAVVLTRAAMVSSGAAPGDFYVIAIDPN